MTETHPRLLTTDLLAELEERLEQAGASAVAATQPGLTPEVMQAIVTPLGISLPLEARTWWGWHDGVPETAGPGATEILRWKWLPLSQAVAQCEFFRTMVAEIEDPRPATDRWGPGWLPVCQAEGSVVIDTDVPDDAPCPVRIWWPDEPEALPDLPSLGELITLWIEAIDRGVWSYDRAADHWVPDHAQRESWRAARRGAV